MEKYTIICTVWSVRHLTQKPNIVETWGYGLRFFMESMEGGLGKKLD